MLLDKSADVNIQDNKGYTALMRAVYYPHNSQTENIVTLLLDKGANIHTRNNLGRNAYDVHKLINKQCDATIAKLLKPRRMRINVTKTVSFHNPITQELKDINIGKYIEETVDNVVFVYRSNEYFFTQRSIIKRNSIKHQKRPMI